MILTKSPALYPYIRSRIQTYSIPAGSFLFREDNNFQGEKPQKIIVGLVSSSSYAGSYEKNPYNFQHKNISQIGLYIDDLPVPLQPLNLNFDTGDYLEAYNLLFTSYGIDGKDKGQDITISDFGKGYCLFAYNLIGGVGNDALSLLEKSNTKLEIRFNKGTDENLTAIVYGQLSDVFTIDQQRNVLPRQL